MYDWKLSGFDKQADRGFAAMADTFYQRADSLPNVGKGYLIYDFPKLFLYRQAIELYLKSAILILRKCQEESKCAVSGHNVVTLNNEVLGLHRKLLQKKNKFENDPFTEPDSIVPILQKIGQVDPAGDYFRYPYTNENVPADAIKSDAFQFRSSIDVLEEATTNESLEETDRWAPEFRLNGLGDLEKLIQPFQHTCLKLQAYVYELKDRFCEVDTKGFERLRD